MNRDKILPSRIDLSSSVSSSGCGLKITLARRRGRGKEGEMILRRYSHSQPSLLLVPLLLCTPSSVIRRDIRVLRGRF